MAYFEPYIDAEGVHIPTYYDIMDHLTNNYKIIFGDDVYLGEETPDYQMMSVVAKCIYDFSAMATQAYNDRNPMYASGDALDVLVQFAGLTRRLPTASTVTLTLSGTEGTEIEQGKQVVDDSGNVWTIDNDVTIPAEGEVEATATCDTLGAIAAPVGAINSIYTPVPGWEEVTNEAEADMGLNLETDAELRVRFAAAHAMTQSGITGSLITGLLGLTGVKTATIVQNDTNSTSSEGLPAHSFCAIVDGGDDDEIAAKILSLKAPGVGTYGSVNSGNGIEVVDAYGHTNVIKFSHPSETTVNITVTLVTFDNYDAERVDEIIKSALMADVNSLGIGKSWMVSMGYKDIYSQFDGGDLPFSVTSITSSNDTNSDGIVECAFDHVLVTDAEHITITTSGGG